MTEPSMSPEDAEFFRRMEQSERDHRDHVWREFQKAAYAALSIGATEMRFDRETFMGIKSSVPREHWPGHGDIRNGDSRLFGALWIGVARDGRE